MSPVLNRPSSKDPAGKAADFPLTPPEIVLMLCAPDGTVRYRNAAAKQLFSFGKRGERGGNLFSLFPSSNTPSDNRKAIFLSAASARGGGYRFLPLPISLHGGRTLFLLTAAHYLAGEATSNRALVVLLGLPFFYPPAGNPSPGRGKRKDELPLVQAVTSFTAEQYFDNKLRGEFSLFPWIDARMLALRFETMPSEAFRSVGRNLRFFKRLLGFSQLFPEGCPFQPKEIMTDPEALFIEQSDAFLVLLLSLARFAAELAALDGRDEECLGSIDFYFQQEQLFMDLRLPFSGERSPKRPRRRRLALQEEDPTDRIRKLIPFPEENFARFPQLSLSRRLRLSILCSVCNRCGWHLEGDLLSGKEGREQLLLRLCTPVLHRKGMVLCSERQDEKCDFLQFLAFLCP